MIWDPKEDGITHINVYSRGQTMLGRNLSNFARTPFELPLYGKFESVEGYWYWHIYNHPIFKSLWGYQVKEFAKRFIGPGKLCLNEKELREAYKAKLAAHPKIQEQLNECKLPLAHYYVYGGKAVVPKQWQWTAELWKEFKK